MFCLFVWHFVCTTRCTAANDRSQIHDRSVHDVRPLHRLRQNLVKLVDKKSSGCVLGPKTDGGVPCWPLKIEPQKIEGKMGFGARKDRILLKKKGGQNGSTYISLRVLEQSTSGDYAGCFLSPEGELGKKKFAREIKYGGAQDVNICQNTTRKKVVFLSILGDVKSNSIGYSYLWKILTMDDEFEAAFEDELEALQEMEGCFLLSINLSFIPTLPVPEIKALSLTKLHTSGGRRNM